MRILPDNPSLDFLRQEAKDVLAALRESTPDATLADAQRTLAGQYGFRAWTDLKAEVERRRAALPAAPPGMAEELASTFDLGTVTAPMAPLAYDPMGRTWSIETDRGRWIAGPVYEWIDGAQAETGVRLRDAAATAGVASPAPVRSRGGRLIETVGADGEPWRVDEWMELGPAPMQPVRASVAKKVGELLGALHGLAIPSDAPINPYLTYRRPQSDWDALLERARRARKPWAEDLARLLPTVAALREIGADVPSDGLILCVCNLIPEAVRTGRGGELVVVEWHFSGSLTPELELGYVLAGWMLRPELNVVGVKALVEGYRSRAGHVPELDLSSFAVLISGALNWTHAQICEAIDPETPDKGAFAEREAVDVLADPLTPSKLEQLLEVVRPALAV